MIKKCAKVGCNKKVKYDYKETGLMGIFNLIDNKKTDEWYPYCSKEHFQEMINKHRNNKKEEVSK